MNINLNIGDALGKLINTAAQRPMRLLAMFSSIAVLAAAAALGFPNYRLPLGIASAIAVLAIVAIGTLIVARGEVEAREEPSTDSEIAEQRERDRRFNANLTHLNSETHRRWMNGEFEDPKTAERLRENFLDAIIASKAARLQNCGLQSASIVIVRHDGDDFLVRRVGGPLKARLSRGDRCRARSDLKDALQNYAPHSHHDWVSCCGRELAIAVTADVPVEAPLMGEVERFMLYYQAEYERLRLFELAPSPKRGNLASS